MQSRNLPNWAVAIIAAAIGAIIGVTPWIVDYCDERGKEIELDKIRCLIQDEARFVLNGEIANAVSLFDENAFVMDAAGGNKDQQIIWKGRDEIEERYRNLPPFTYLKHAAIDINLELDENYARATADTIGTYIEGGKEIHISSDRGERWTLEKIDGKWMITCFTYGLH